MADTYHAVEIAIENVRPSVQMDIEETDPQKIESMTASVASKTISYQIVPLQ